MRRVISFCLWGDNPKYTIGAIKNAELAKFVYTGWETWFYVADCVPEEIIKELAKNDAKVINKGTASYLSMFWRFELIEDQSVDVFISRDTDSRLNYRERRAVDEWISSEKVMHIMRDHSWHGTQMLGGMWGLKGTIDNFNELVANFIEANFDVHQLEIGKYDLDQAFLRNVIFPNFKDNSTIHDEFFDKKPFPTPRENNEYVGSPFNGDDILEIDFI